MLKAKVTINANPLHQPDSGLPELLRRIASEIEQGQTGGLDTDPDWEITVISDWVIEWVDDDS